MFRDPFHTPPLDLRSPAAPASDGSDASGAQFEGEFMAGHSQNFVEKIIQDLQSGDPNKVRRAKSWEAGKRYAASSGDPAARRMLQYLHQRLSGQIQAPQGFHIGVPHVRL
jgi:hypothetical protein